MQLLWKDKPIEITEAEQTTQLVGRTRGDLVVVFDGSLSLKGEILAVKITDARNLTLFAQRIESPLSV